MENNKSAGANLSSAFVKKDHSIKGEEELLDEHGKIYRQSGHILIIKSTCKAVTFGNNDGGNRGAIVGFSQSSACRMRRYLRECVADYRVFITLTYPCEYPTDGIIVKNHLRRFLQECKRYLERERVCRTEYSFFWFFEFQNRGAPHFHVFSTHELPKEWVSKTWFRIVDSEDDRHLAAGTRIEHFKSGRYGSCSYASKYAAKHCQKLVPDEFQNVGRFWGVYGRKTVESAACFVSRRESSSESIKKAEMSLYLAVNRAVEYGNATVLVKDDGVRVVLLRNVSTIREIKRLVQMIALKVHLKPALMDAVVVGSIDSLMDYDQTL